MNSHNHNAITTTETLNTLPLANVWSWHVPCLLSGPFTAAPHSQTQMSHRSCAALSSVSFVVEPFPHPLTLHRSDTPTSRPCAQLSCRMPTLDWSGGFHIRFGVHILARPPHDHQVTWYSGKCRQARDGGAEIGDLVKMVSARHLPHKGPASK